MIIMIHREGRIVEEVLIENAPTSIHSNNPIEVLFILAKKYPEELLIWVDVHFKDDVNWNYLPQIFHSPLIMASYAINSRSIPPEIGYIDQLPFVNPNYSVKYPTWLMSTDIGGIHASVLLAFESWLKFNFNLDYFLNSIAKVGQQNSLLCYSEPKLTKLKQKNLAYRISKKALFNFVSRHYKKEWLVVLYYCFSKFEKSNQLASLINFLPRKSFFQNEITLPEFAHLNDEESLISIDVVIPTLDRKEYLKNVLIDLDNQKLKPNNVIIIEQGKDDNAVSELDFLKEDWSFNIVHHFLNYRGACKARNLAIDEIRSDLVFFADDDIRFDDMLLYNAVAQMQKLKVGCLNFNAQQGSDKPVFKKVKQWGAFASGASLVQSKYLKNCRFDLNLEKGFGEDIDFGMQLRENACDILYHPFLKLDHLKASSGGFRNFMSNTINKDALLSVPKPAPTMMILIKKWYSRYMMRGYRISLNLKYYRHQPERNPFKYLKNMKQRWKLSEELSDF